VRAAPEVIQPAHPVAAIGVEVEIPAFMEERAMTTAIGNQTEANRETIREAFEAWKNGTGSITDVFAPEMVWRIEGHSVASKPYESK
jgi:hypothetical protein